MYYKQKQITASQTKIQAYNEKKLVWKSFGNLKTSSQIHYLKWEKEH